MKNGLYSIHITMLDGVKGRDSGVLILRDGLLLGGGPYFWSIGAYPYWVRLRAGLRCAKEGVGYGWRAEGQPWLHRFTMRIDRPTGA
jgi:hypothetical protein